MSKLVTIYGGSGFLGRYVAQRLAKQGWRVRAAVRRPNEAGFLRPYGAVGQVEPIFCNIRDDASVAAAMQGADVVINCVGVGGTYGKNNMQAVHVEGAARIARIAAAQGVAGLVHVSAIGADAEGPSAYFQSKGEGEAAVLEAFENAVVLRPSLMFGPEDGFINLYASMSRFGPFMPVIGANTRVQPVFVDDVAAAVEKAAIGAVPAGTYELGGPEVLTIRALVEKVLGIIRRKKILLPQPGFVARMMAGGLDLAQSLTMGLFTNSLINRDQVKSLAVDNVVSDGAAGFEALGIVPTPMEAELPEYMWKFRPSGQYAAIKESAAKLKV
ncbi:complex I NDUFA9 subunit family protein [Oceanicola sp. 502str15]|uniref:complex I NDUFA9 subunit family protein n=1 Tax=Oceanicola sp. 502str15 TaxID=2696061 RepID=UPI002095BEF7|nr:complex I NDUFA9 subunit family protein [Oceanicola sp. 502str15]MCO6384264.1 NAD(P)H-binding protein [Oceanicola sp. 502str15]